MENDETHIIHRILKGETSLYEYFLDKYSQQVFILIIRIVENQEDAEELTQDTFLKAFEHLSSFKAESSFSTWIYRIAYNTAISATRKRKQELIVMDSAMLIIIRKSKFPQNPKRSVRFSGKRTKRSVQKRKARNTQKAETKVL